MSNQSTYSRALALIRSMSWKDRAAILSEQMIDFRYSSTGQMVLAHQIGDEGEEWEMMDNVRCNSILSNTAPDYVSACDKARKECAA